VLEVSSLPQVVHDVVLAHALLVQQLTQEPVLVRDAARGHLDLCRGLYALELACSETLLEFLEVLSLASTRSSLVVSDAREIGPLLRKRRKLDGGLAQKVRTI
jgi:hypothetical protein